MHRTKNIHDEYNFGDLTMYCNKCKTCVRIGNLNIHLSYSVPNGEDYFDVDPNLFIRRNYTNPNESPINYICPYCETIETILIPTEIADEIILLYKHGFHPIDMKYGSNNNDSEMYYISFKSDEFKVLEKCWKSAKLITLMKNSVNTYIQNLAIIIGAKTIYDTLNFRSTILSKIKDDMYYLFENDSVFSFRNNSDIILNKPYTIQDLKKAIDILCDIVKIYQTEIMS